MDLEQIRQIKRSVETDLLKIPGVNGVAIGFKYRAGKQTDELAIRVYVEHKGVYASGELIPIELQGVKTDVVEVKKPTSMILKAPVAQMRIMVDKRLYNPLVGGISLGPCREIGGFVFTGTLGSIVFDNATGAPMLLSNYHVMVVDAEGKIGDTMVQPGQPDGGDCPEEVVGELARSRLGDNVDCAVTLQTARGYRREIVEIGPVTEVTEACLGMPVHKRGRTTELTYGTVDAIDYTTRIDYGDGLGELTFTNQIGIMADLARNAVFSDHGDSGSLIVDDCNRVIGLLFAGSGSFTVANPIQWVFEAMQVSLAMPEETD